MHRECLQCHRAFTAQDFVKEESHEMEAERKAQGLEGVRFLYYSCPACGCADIFVDIHHRKDEAPEAFERRRAELEAAVRQVRGDKTAVVITVALIGSGVVDPSADRSTRKASPHSRSGASN